MSDNEHNSTGQLHLLELLYDGNTYYLNMATINTYDQFYDLYQDGYVMPSSNNAVWRLTNKGYTLLENVRRNKDRGRDETEQLLLFAFEQGIEYAKRCSQHQITRWDFLQNALKEQEKST